MSRFIVSPNLTATGNINPCTFVKMDTSTPFGTLQAGANARTVGISQEGTKYAPGVGPNTYAFESGDAAVVYGLGSVCLVIAGSGGFTTGDLLESDANGNAITSSTTGHNVGAIAIESASMGSKGEVQVVMFNHV